MWWERPLVRATVTLARLLLAVPLYLLGVGLVLVTVGARALFHLVLWVVLLEITAGLVGWPSGTTRLGVYAVALVGIVVWVVYFSWTALRAATRAEPATLLAETRLPDGDREHGIQSTLREMCRTVDRPVPALRVREDERPICYTVRYAVSSSPYEVLNRTDLDPRPTADDAEREINREMGAYEAVPEKHAVVLSTGLIERLSDRHLAAVLAHEVAHIQNGDVALVQRLLVPLFWAEKADPTGRGAVFGPLALSVPVWLLRAVTAVAVNVVSRGRELSADAGSVAITGDPAALVTVFREFAVDASRSPETDLRAVAALNVLPGLGTGSYLRHAHPSTELRIKRLEAKADER